MPITNKEVVQQFVKEMRAKQGITPHRRNASIQERPSLGQHQEMLVLLTALCSAEEGFAEWYELEGYNAKLLLDELIRTITVLVETDSQAHVGTIFLLFKMLKQEVEKPEKSLRKKN